MYDIILSKTWDYYMESDCVFKSVTFKRMIEINGSEFEEGDDSVIVIFFNLFNGTPMIIYQYYPRPGVEKNLPESNFIVSRAEGVYDGTECTTYTFVAKGIDQSID